MYETWCLLMKCSGLKGVGWWGCVRTLKYKQLFYHSNISRAAAASLTTVEKVLTQIYAYKDFRDFWRSLVGESTAGASLEGVCGEGCLLHDLQLKNEDKER